MVDPGTMVGFIVELLYWWIETSHRKYLKLY